MAFANKLKSFRFLFLTINIIIIDQVSKFIALSVLPYQAPQKILPIFNFTLTFNTGAAFGMLNDASGWQRWFFMGVAAAVGIAILIWLYKLAAKHAWQEAGLCLILGGALGNVIDRIYHGYVVDFLEFHYQKHYFPAFNIADAAITIGAAILILEAIITARPNKTSS